MRYKTLLERKDKKMKLREIEISSTEAIERLDNIFLINSIFFLILGIIVLFSASNYDNYNEKSRRKIMASGVIIIVLVLVAQPLYFKF
ncbi:hypothetical protein [Campylobacter concisus]|uniref:hypothetical protein n=1 Tax=Campylobacter concisus TaxID=199 RepID=UPI00112FBA78|nr:hypothetical protein [Campylobacter concisus]